MSKASRTFKEEGGYGKTRKDRSLKAYRAHRRWYTRLMDDLRQTGRDNYNQLKLDYPQTWPKNLGRRGKHGKR